VARPPHTGPPGCPLTLTLSDSDHGRLREVVGRLVAAASAEHRQHQPNTDSICLTPTPRRSTRSVTRRGRRIPLRHRRRRGRLRDARHPLCRLAQMDVRLIVLPRDGATIPLGRRPCADEVARGPRRAGRAPSMAITVLGVARLGSNDRLEGRPSEPALPPAFSQLTGARKPHNYAAWDSYSDRMWACSRRAQW
jgi:hypothetical protein